MGRDATAHAPHRVRPPGHYRDAAASGAEQASRNCTGSSEAAQAEGDEAGESEAEPGRARGQLPRGRKRREAIEAGARDTPYDTPLIGGILPKGAGAGAGRPGRCGRRRPPYSRRRRDGERGARVQPRGFRAAGRGRARGAVVRFGRRAAGVTRGYPGQAGRACRGGDARRTTSSEKDGKPEQLMLTGASDASYTLPPAALLRPGTAPKAKSRVRVT